MIEVREELPGDAEAIREVNTRAFDTSCEADIVDRLRRGCEDLLSLVALEGERIVGHILFSPAVIEVGAGEVVGMGLAPIAVLPEHQGQGIGAELVRTGMARLEELGCPFVIVLGHPGYYPRFGFEPASRHGIRCEWEVPDEVFLVSVLDEGAMEGVSGLARYRPELMEEM